jgi:hypothetical protein
MLLPGFQEQKGCLADVRRLGCDCEIRVRFCAVPALRPVNVVGPSPLPYQLGTHHPLIFEQPTDLPLYVSRSTHYLLVL